MKKDKSMLFIRTQCDICAICISVHIFFGDYANCNRCTHMIVYRCKEEVHTNRKEITEMFKDNRYINAGTTEVYRYGHKAVERATAFLTANEAGYYSIPCDGGKYWTIGTSEGKFGEFARIGDTCFSVNRGGFMYAKAGTEKGEKFVEAIKAMINYMHKLNQERLDALMSDEDDD